MKLLQISWIIRLFMILIWLGLITLFFFTPRFFSSASDKHLNLLVWPAMIDVKKINEFEQKTGIKISVTYYESNEELLRKFQVTHGQGYDLVIGSDMSVDYLRKQGLLKKIDKNRLNFASDFNPLFVGHYFDKNTEYSLPYYLGIYGLGIDRAYFGPNLPARSWDLLFKNYGYCVTMTDDTRRAIALAGFYLFGFSETIKPEHFKEIQNLLMHQKSWVELYSDVRGEEVLAAQSCPVVLTISPDLWRMQREFPHLEFVIPQEGSFMVLDSFIIPQASAQQDHVYALLNYLYSPEVMKHNVTHYGFCPPLRMISVQEYGIICPTEEIMSRLRFFNGEIPKEALNNLWIAVMAQ